LSPTSERHTQIWVVGAVAGLATLAWVYLFLLHREMSVMAANAQAMLTMGMRANDPWTAADVWFGFVMWTVMMAGMMAPSAAPILLLVSRSASSRGGERASLTVAAFGVGYFAIWTGFAAIATLVQGALHNMTLLSPSMATVSPRAAGIILVIAGLYQLTPEKRVCLVHCRNPIDFLMTSWRPGRAGAFHMGLQHGLFCLGCCWALTLVLFGVGVMNLVWVAAISVVVLMEKAGWGGLILSRATGVALILFGGYSAL
jgi:predicted metal-binding membrane protein